MELLWIDTDLALGAPRGDVDDGFALAAALGAVRRDRAALIGISTVAGNVPARRAEQCVRRLCAAAGVQTHVVCGAQRKGQMTGAAAQIAGLTAGARIVALGPLTNVARACGLDSSLPARARLAVVGGNLSSRGRLPPLWPHEFNLTRDREAAREAFAHAWSSVVLYPLNVVRRLRVGRRRWQELSEISPLGRFLADGSQRWLKRSRWRRPGRGFPVWDLPAVLDAVGALDGIRELVPLPPALRALTGRAEMECLVAFDPEAAWRRFLELVG
ncbi:MAG: nucleoside hydrolase [Acidobacteriota bacterium]